MKRLVLVPFLFVTNAALSQCVSVQEMRSLYFKDLDDQDAFLESRGYRVDNTLSGHHVSWSDNAKNDFLISYEKGKISSIGYYSFGTGKCYELNRNQIKTLGLAKDFQRSYTYGNRLTFYYSNKKYGVITSKGSNDDGSLFWEVHVITLASYLKLLADAKIAK